MQPLTLLALASVAIASPVAIEQRSSPSVTIKNGTVVGSTSFLSGIESFKGIPFAKPPVGPLRLKPPQTIDTSYGTIQATEYGKGCINTLANSLSAVNASELPGEATNALLNNPLIEAVSNTGEDCLTLNVQRPAGTDSSSKLPVAVWIYGGGFALGGSSMYDASKIISRSVDLDAPIVYVSMNYRLNAYGFLPGKEVKADGSSNLGLRDQRKALEWVSQNVAAFGGDPDKVTIWGESAGSISVFDQTIINGGQAEFEGRQLFHGGIMNSGSVTPTRDVDSDKGQLVYDTVIKAAGCDSASDSLSCLRDLSEDDFTAAADSVPGILSYRSIDLAYLPRPDPSDSFFPLSPEDAAADNGSHVLNVPIIIGDQQDEGTLFSLSQSNLSTTDDVISYLGTFFPGIDTSHITELVNSYPDDPAAGSPFDTGDFNNVYPQFKRVAAILGDITFNLVRRGYLANATAAGIPAWSYLNTYLHGTPVLGTLHGADLVQLYNNIPTTLQTPISPIDYYISFFNYHDPNRLFQVKSKANLLSKASAVHWPQWTDGGRDMLGFAALNTSVIKDNFREVQYEALLKQTGTLRI